MHSHDHMPIAVPDGTPGYYEVMETATDCGEAANEW